MSERRACAVVGADRKSMRYRSCRPDDADVRSRLRELAGQRRRFDYRRPQMLLRRDGVAINRKTQRLYREKGLTIRRRRGRRRAGARARAGAAQPALEPVLRS